MSQQAEAEWKQVLEVIRGKVRAQQFDAWFRRISPVSIDSSHVVLRVPNEYFSEWLQANYLGTIRDAFSAVTGNQPEIEFEMKYPADRQLVLPSDEVRPTDAARPRVQLNEHYTFANFVVGPCNRLAHAAALAIVEAPGTAYNPFFVHGGVGLGKTHLLQAICHAVLERDSSATVLYLSCETFMNQFISGIQHGNVESFRSRYRNTDILLIDDVQFLSRGEGTQEEFFHTFNTLYNAQRQIILSSDGPPEEIPTLELRLVSRFKWGLVSRLDPPDYETRVAIVKKKAEVRGMQLPEEVLHYVATRIETNIRELEGSITRLVGYASLSNQRVDLAMAQEVLEDQVTPRREITIGDILNIVTEHFGVRVADLQSKKKSKSIAFPRQVCMYLARALTRHSLQEIGGYFGGRDHSTVLYAEEKIRQLQEERAEVKTTLQQIESKLRRV